MAKKERSLTQMYQDLGVLRSMVDALCLSIELSNGLPFPPDCDQTPNRDGPRRTIMAIREEMKAMRDEAKLRKTPKK